MDKITTTTNFLSTIKPTLVLRQACGLSSYECMKTGLKKSRKKYIYNFIVLALYLVPTQYCLSYRFRQGAMDLNRITDLLQQCTFPIYCFVVFFTSIFYREELFSLILHMDNYDNKYQRIFGTKSQISYDSTKGFIKYNAICRSFLFVIFCNVVWALPAVNVSHFTAAMFSGMYAFPLILNSVISLQILTYIYIIRLRLKCLNNELGNVNESILDMWSIRQMLNKPTKPTKTFSNTSVVINRISDLHHSLTWQIEMLNRTFGFELLAIFSIGFVNIIIGAYYTCVGITIGLRWKKVFNKLFLAINFAVDCVYVCYMCTETIEEVNRTGILIHKIETDEPELRDEIEMFSLQIANEKVEFNAAGFFPINYTLLFSIIGGVTTYIIILIQLSNK